MVHQRQSLPFGLETGDHVAAVHARFDDLERHLAADRLLLFGNKHQSHTPFANLLHQLVRTDGRAGAFRDRLVIGGCIQDCGTPLEETVGRLVCLEQPFDPCA